MAEKKLLGESIFFGRKNYFWPNKLFLADTIFLAENIIFRRINICWLKKFGRKYFLGEVWEKIYFLVEKIIFCKKKYFCRIWTFLKYFLIKIFYFMHKNIWPKKSFDRILNRP